MKFIHWIWRYFYPFAVSSTIDRCAKICDKNAADADKMYYIMREIASHPNEDIGVLKYACYNGQAGRDANDIRKLKNV